jgi:hypothetical protein
MSVIQKLQVVIEGDTAALNKATKDATETVGKFGQRVERHVGSAHRQFHFLGREVEGMGKMLAGSNETMGKSVEALGGTISAVGVAQHSVHALGTAYQWLASQEAIANAMSGPVGWLALAGGVAVATAAVYAFSSASEDAHSKHTALIEEAKEHAKELTKLLKDIEKAQGKTATVNAGNIDFKPKDITKASVERAGEAVADAKETMDELKKQYDDAQAHLQKVREFYKSTGYLTGNEKDERNALMQTDKGKAALKEVDEMTKAYSDANQKYVQMQEGLIKLQKEYETHGKKDEATKKYDEMLTKAKDEQTLLEQGASALELEKAKRDGLSDAQITELGNQLKINEAIKEQQKETLKQTKLEEERAKQIESNAKSVIAHTQTQADKFREQINNAIDLLREKALTELQYNQAVKTYMEDYAKTQDTGKASVPGVYEVGSDQANKLQMDMYASQIKREGENNQIAILQSQVKQLEQIARNTAKQAEVIRK